MDDEEPSGFVDRWEAERTFRLQDLTSRFAKADLKASKAAWVRLVKEFGPRRSAEALVHIPLSMVMATSWQGRVVDSSDVVDSAPRASVLTQLANGGADGLALRLFLSLWAARQICDPERISELSAIPLFDRGRAKSPFTWQSLTRVGPTPRGNPGRTPTRDQSRRRIVRAAERLEQLRLVEVARNHLGQVSGLRVNYVPVHVPVPIRGGCSEVFLTLDFWRQGWNALLWADDIVNLLVYLSGPPSLVYQRRPARFNYRAMGRTMRPPSSLTPRQFDVTQRGEKMRVTWFIDDEGDAYEVLPEPAVFLSERRRLQQFGLHANRYTKIADLVDFGLLTDEFKSRRPNWKARAEHAVRTSAPTELEVLRAQGSARAFLRHDDVLKRSAADVLGQALVRSTEPRDLRFAFPHSDSFPGPPELDPDTAFTDWLTQWDDDDGEHVPIPQDLGPSEASGGASNS